MAVSVTAQALLRSVGLVADGPILWAAQVTSRSPGVFVIELPRPLEAAPIDTAALRRWLERVPTLRLDDRRPTVNELQARLGGFWLRDQAVVYIGHSAKSLGGRVAALYATDLGDRRPHPGGHWLQTLRGIDKARVWWAETDAPEEYADALLSAFAAGMDPASVARLHDRSVVLPFANRETTTGQRKEHGIQGFLVPEDAPPAAVRTGTVRRLPPGSAVDEPVRRRAAPARDGVPRPPRAAPAARSTAPTPATRPTPQREVVSAEGLALLRAELDDLINVQRPQVILRVKTARELGDLRENADYEAARNEQSFLEGRIQSIQARLDRAQVADRSGGEGVAVVGATVVVEMDGERASYLLVGAGEADPTRDRISYASPVGRALIGARAGDVVTATLPGNELVMRILEVR